MQVGIDAVSFAVPEGYIDLGELAEARGIPPEKYFSGLGVRQMAVAAFHEDPVAMAANAARRLFRQSGASVDEVGLCIVGTETAVDHAKPVAVYLHSLLGLPSTCRVFETKHACFGGTAGILHAIDWIRSGSHRGRSALVVCTDIARYPLQTAGEPTQGAGAVAMLIRERPRLLAIDAARSGSYARDVYDFWRPLARKDALTDGHFSVQCYLEALSGSYQAFRSQPGASDAFDRYCYHVPYGKMARKAHRHLRGLQGLDEAAADAQFEQEVAPSLIFPSLVGNVYTGSLYLAVASLLHHQAARLEGRPIALFSYGSGCVAEFFPATVQPGAGAFAAALQLDQPLTQRTKLSIPAYESIRNADDTNDTRQAPPGMEPWSGQGTDTPSLHDQVVYLGIDTAERRVYKNRTTA